MALIDNLHDFRVMWEGTRKEESILCLERFLELMQCKQDFQISVSWLQIDKISLFTNLLCFNK